MLHLQRSIGNQATSRFVVDRQEHAEPGQTGAGGGEGVTGGVPQLTPEQQRRLLYARTTLAHVSPMAEGDLVVMQTLIAGTPLLELMVERDALVREVEGDMDEDLDWDVDGQSFPPPDLAPLGLEVCSVELHRKAVRIERLDSALGAALDALGLDSESELRRYIDEEFPRLFLRRAREIAITALADNWRIAKAETDRFTVGPGDPGDFSGLRSAAGELDSLLDPVDQAWSALADRSRDNWGSRRDALDELDVDWQTGGDEFWAPWELVDPTYGEMEEQLVEAGEPYLARRAELGLQYPILLRDVEYRALADASDEQIEELVSSEITTILQNIEDTKQNVLTGDLKVWHLPTVLEMTTQDLGVDPGSPLMFAVRRKIEEDEQDDAVLDAGIAAIGITAAILAAIPTAGASLTVAGTLVAVGAGAIQLSRSVTAYLVESAAGDVALDPAIADISVNQPDLLPIAIDLVSLGFDAFEVVRLVNLLGDSIRVARRTGDVSELVMRAAAELPPGDANRLLAAVSQQLGTASSISRVVVAIGTRFRKVDLDDVYRELERVSGDAVRHAIDDFRVTGRIRPLTEDTLVEVLGADRAARLITEEQVLTANGIYHPATGYIFVRPGRSIEEYSSVLLHEVTHYIQNTYTPMMSMFLMEFEAFKAQRDYLIRLMGEGVDPDVAFPTWKNLAYSTDDDIVAKLARPPYNLVPPSAIDTEAAVWNVLSTMGRYRWPLIVGAGVGGGAAAAAVASD